MFGIVCQIYCCGRFCGTQPRDPFHNDFSIAIQIRWKFRFTLISILIQWSLQNFVHGTTAVLSWHVQKIVAIWWPATELQQDEVSIEFELRAKSLVKRTPVSPIIREFQWTLWPDELIWFSDKITDLQQQLDGVMKLCFHNRMNLKQNLCSLERGKTLKYTSTEWKITKCWRPNFRVSL